MADDAIVATRAGKSHVVTDALLLPVGHDWYAIDVAQVREVVAYTVPETLPTAPSMLLGAFNLRGDIVPLFDTAALLGFGAMHGPEFAVVIVCIDGVAALTTTGIPYPVVLDEPVSTAETEGAIATYVVGERLATLIDVEALIARSLLGD